MSLTALLAILLMPNVPPAQPVDSMEVHGRLLSGEKGVQARIQFDMAAYARHVNATTADDGSFTVTFPAKGQWHPIVLRDRGSRVELPPLDIPRSSGSELVLRLPAGGVKGNVLDSRGHPANRAVVSVFAGQHLQGQTSTDAEGTFDLNGIAPGKYNVDAEIGDEFAGPIEVSIGEQERVEVELRAGKVSQLRGTIYTPGGDPASGAIVRRVEPESGAYEDVIADAHGMFAIAVKPRFDAIDLVVLNPPYPVAVRRVPLAKRDPRVDVRLSAAGALLRIVVLRTPPWPRIALGGGPAIALANMLLPRFGGGTHREVNKGTFEVNVEPGDYVVCTAARDDCRSLHLAPNSEVLANLTASPQ